MAPQDAGKLTQLVVLLFLLWSATACHGAKLTVSQDGRHLLKDGEPFFYLCDTGWDVFMIPTREEADEYLQDRADKGFNVIAAVLIGYQPGVDQTNAYGEPPLTDKDPAQPNDRYFEHVDYVVRKANSLGMFVAMAPSWSDWMYEYVGRGPHPFTVENSRSFGEYVGSRYKDDDIIWVIGGDRNPEGYEDILTAMAEGLDAGDGESDFLMTVHGVKATELIPPDNVYHERLSSSSHLFGNTEWLDFHGAYSGHQWGYPTYRLTAQDRAMEPTRPVVDLEPCYENHPYLPDGSAYYANPRKWDGSTRGTAALIREQAYWALLAGAAGHTYACHEVWQFHDPANRRQRPYSHPNAHWRKAMDFPGASQMGIMRRLFESRPWHTMEPDQNIIEAGQGSGETHVQAARASDGTFLMVYLPRGGQVTADVSKIAADEAVGYWFNPKNGEATEIGRLPASGPQEFAAPSSGVDNDWVLVLDDPRQRFGPPGQSHSEVTP